MDEDFDVVAVDHVQVTAPDELVDETCDWYRSCLGLEEMDKPEGTRPKGAWFHAGSQEVHVSVDEHNPHKTAHFGLVVTDFDAAIGRLRSSGCHIEQASAIPGRHRCYTRDPAGNRIEIVAFDDGERAASAGRPTQGGAA
jgi:catechol 2,3-dioxygenase-like lactoylglutathione lyase family enzyme